MSKGQCLDCEDIIESRHRHDFVKCSCGNAFLDGGDEYIRAGGNIAIIQDGVKLYPLQQDQELSKLLMDAIDEDFFDGYLDDDFDNYLDDDFDDFNLGFQAGVMDERERIIKLLEEHKCTFTETDIVECWCGSFNDSIALIKGESNGTN